MNLCKDCKFCERSVIGEVTPDYYFAKCTRRKNDIDLVSGDIPKRFCSSERLGGGLWPYLDGSCGKQGRFFEPMEAAIEIPNPTATGEYHA